MKRIINGTNEYESIGTFKLSKDKTPIAYKNKVDELVEEQGMSQEEAEKAVNNMEIELEIYYEKGYGLFAVESEICEGGSFFSPYTKEEYNYDIDRIAALE